MPTTRTGRTTMPTKELKAALAAVSKIVSRTPILPVLENVLISDNNGEKSITVTNLQNYVKVTVEHSATTDSQFVALVPFRMLYLLVKSLESETISLTVGDEVGVVVINCSEGVFKMSSEDAGEFPKKPVLNLNREGFTIPKSIFDTAAKSVARFATTDDLRPAMTGILITSIDEKVTFVATDGHRLIEYVADAPFELTSGLILQRETVLLLSNLKGKDEYIFFSIGSGYNIHIKHGNVSIIARVIDERYPDYKSAIPNGAPLLTPRIGLSAFRKAVYRSGLFSNSTTHQISLKFIQNSLQIFSQDLDYFNSSTQSMEMLGVPEDFEIGFNSKFLLDALSTFSGAATFQFESPNRAALIFPEKPKGALSVTILVMPVVLNEFV